MALKRTTTATMQLALFDLDHTLLSGDSDVLWSDFLIDQGLLRAGLRDAARLPRAIPRGHRPSDHRTFDAATLTGHD